MHTKRAPMPTHHSGSSGPHRGGPIVDDKQTKLPPIKHRIEEKVRVRVTNKTARYTMTPQFPNKIL